MTAKGPYNPLNTRILLLLCCSVFIPAAEATTATLTESTAYASQRPCAKSCFYWGSSTQGGADFLAERIGCAVDPIENECICCSDLQQTADSFLRKCVSENCNANAIDVSSAIKLYDDYCTSNGYTRATSTAQMTGTTSSGTLIAPATVTVTVLQTVLASGGRRLRPAVLGRCEDEVDPCGCLDPTFQASAATSTSEKEGIGSDDRVYEGVAAIRNSDDNDSDYVVRSGRGGQDRSRRWRQTEGGRHRRYCHWYSGLYRNGRGVVVFIQGSQAAETPRREPSLTMQCLSLSKQPVALADLSWN